jgi:hypothetical protein
MADEQKKSLRDLMDDAGAQHGITQRKLWGWVLTAMANKELLPILPEGMTLKRLITIEHLELTQEWVRLYSARNLFYFLFIVTAKDRSGAISDAVC